MSRKSIAQEETQKQEKKVVNIRSEIRYFSVIVILMLKFEIAVFQFFVKIKRRDSFIYIVYKFL